MEGNNVYDLAFGTSAAKNVTVSFYVKCSLTGTFGASLVNGAHNRSNIQTYTINSANTWEYKTFTVAGDTSGTWATDNSNGLQLMFDMGSGSNNLSDTTNQWLSDEYHGTTSSVKLTHTNSATIQFAGVQLEAGTQATAFEHRSYGEELALCQRYYQVLATGDQAAIGGGFAFQTNRFQCNCHLPVEMRTVPTLDEQMTGGTKYRINMGNADQNTGITPSLSSVVSNTRTINLGWSSLASNVTNGDGGQVRKQSDSGILGVQAEL